MAGHGAVLGIGVAAAAVLVAGAVGGLVLGGGGAAPRRTPAGAAAAPPGPAAGTARSTAGLPPPAASTTAAPAPATTPPRAAAPGGGPGDDQLALRAVLVQGDLPPAWTPNGEGSPSLSAEAGSPAGTFDSAETDYAQCALPTLPPAAAEAESDDFSPEDPNTNADATSSADVYATTADAAAVFTAVSSRLPCAIRHGGGLPSALPAPGVGDASYAMRATITGPGGTDAEDLVLVRVGRVDLAFTFDRLPAAQELRALRSASARAGAQAPAGAQALAGGEALAVGQATTTAVETTSR